MSMSDPISDLLTRIRNANKEMHQTVEAPASGQKEALCRLLLRQGFIEDVERVDEGPQGTLRITLKYTDENERVIRGIRRVSKPSLRIYRRKKDINQVLSGLGIAVVSTSKGLMTGSEARKAGVGGEIVCEVW